jgi:hypothetical protein
MNHLISAARSGFVRTATTTDLSAPPSRKLLLVYPVPRRSEQYQYGGLRAMETRRWTT